MTVCPVWLVSVTYGNRWNLLQSAIASALRENVEGIVIVDNNSKYVVADNVAREFGDKVVVVRLPTNTGSAVGFKVGIELALSQGAQYVLLLDDDNRLEAGAVATLSSALAELSPKVGLSRTAVLGFRPDHQPHIFSRPPVRSIRSNSNSFFGIHIAYLPIKIWRRFRRNSKLNREKRSKAVLPAILQLETAPYGGLLFHRSLIDRIGLPDPRLVLYSDDTEFSFRIKKAGGDIWLVTDARISDLDISWNVQKRFRSSFDVWLTGDGDWRAYYAARNASYFGTHCRPHSRALRWFNKQIYLMGLQFFAWKYSRRARLKLILEAIRDGEACRLGMNPKFTL